MSSTTENVLVSLAAIWTACCACCCCLPLLVAAVVIGVSIPIYFLTIGIIKINACVADPNIPIWMIVMGGLMLLHMILEKANNMGHTAGTCGFRITFLVGLIIGSVLVFSAYPNRDQCDPLVFYSAFVYCTLFLIFSFLVLLITCSSCCYSLCTTGKATISIDV